MPYILSEQRKQFDELLDQFPPLETKGQLEYCMYKLMVHHMKSNNWTYSDLHNTTYAAHHCGDEFRRRHLDVREDAALERNGDIT